MGHRYDGAESLLDGPSFEDRLSNLGSPAGTRLEFRSKASGSCLTNVHSGCPTQMHTRPAPATSRPASRRDHVRTANAVNDRRRAQADAGGAHAVDRGHPAAGDHRGRHDGQRISDWHQVREWHGHQLGETLVEVEADLTGSAIAQVFAPETALLARPAGEEVVDGQPIAQF